jgi:pectate lyase
MRGHATLTHAQLPPDRGWVLVIRRFVIVLLALGILVAAVRVALPPPPPPPSGIVGYGASTVGGRGGTVLHPTSLAALRSALNASGPRIIALPTSRQTWDLAGNDLMLNKPYVTLDGGAIIFKGGAVKVTASQVILQNVTSHAGDQAGNPADVDALTVNGNSACIDHIVLSHVEGLWGPDVGGLAVLGCVHDLTVQYSILGEGLLRSRHPGSSASNGHAMALNIADNYGNPANRVTVYGNLLTTAAERNPRLVGATCTDLIDNVFYNYSEGPSGNPRSVNLIGNTYQRGPAPAAAGFSFSTLEWRYAKDIDFFSTLIPNAAWTAGNRALGFGFATPSGDDALVRRASPACPPSVASQGATAAYASVLSLAGPAIRSDQTARLLANVAHGTGTYYSGKRGPEPRPSWP